MTKNTNLHRKQWFSWEEGGGGEREEGMLRRLEYDCWLTSIHLVKTPSLFVITPRACARGKVSGCRYCHYHCRCHCRGHKNCQIVKNKCWTDCSMPPNDESDEKLSMFASNRLGRPMSTTNHAFSLAMPIKHTYQCHVLVTLHMLELEIGKGLLLQRQCCHGAQGMIVL